MTPAPPKPTAAPPDDPVGGAGADPALRNELVAHALSILDKWLADKPRAVRRQEADDVVHQAMEKALERRATYDPALGTVAAWVHGFVVNVAYSHARAVRRGATADPAAWDRLAADLAPPADAADARLDLPVYLDRLTPDQRAILDFRYRDGLDGDALAARLGISSGAARVRLCRALDAARIVAGATPAEDRP
jgi:RNA polymerase sigma factor (sigma-70 family)